MDNEFNWNTESVRVVGAVEVLIGTFGALAIAFGADGEITAAVMAVASALVGVVTAFVVRTKVTPYRPEGEVDPESMDADEDFVPA